MPRAAATPPPPDPLADLRPPDEPAGPPAEPEPEEAAVQATHDLEWHRASAAQVVVAWHQDVVGVGALHGGGVCACRHLAMRAIQAIHGAPVEREPEETEAPE